MIEIIEWAKRNAQNLLTFSLVVATFGLVFVTYMLWDATNKYAQYTATLALQTEKMANTTDFDVKIRSRPYLSIKNYQVTFLGKDNMADCITVRFSSTLSNVGAVPLGYNITATSSNNALIKSTKVAADGILFPTEETTVFLPSICTTLGANFSVSDIISRWDSEILIDFHATYWGGDNELLFTRNVTARLFPTTYDNQNVNFGYYLVNESAS